MNDLTSKIKLFLATNPNDEQIEEFYINQILPIDKRSINEILQSEILALERKVAKLDLEEDIYNCWLCGNEIEYIDNGICKGCHTQTRDIN
jgi:hypothetical protein